MVRKKKSYYLDYSYVKRLSGFSFYRLSVYHKNKLVNVIGYLDVESNILFVNFSLLYFYIYRGFDFLSFKGLVGRNFREVDIGSILMLGLFNWLFYAKKEDFLIMPRRFWIEYLNRALYIVYYLLFRNIISFDGVTIRKSRPLAKILSKRFLIIENLFLL
jgi:hypothetical protein